MFTSTPTRRLKVSEMSSQDLDGLKVKQDRLMRDIHHTCQWGTGQSWGEYVLVMRCGSQSTDALLGIQQKQE